MTRFTDSNDFEIALLREYSTNTCNGFAFAYIEANPGAVVKVAEMESGGQLHCWVYDAGLNLTIDPTLGQFDGLDAGYWEGEDHPHRHPNSQVDEYDDIEAFEEDFGGAYSPFYL